MSIYLVKMTPEDFLFTPATELSRLTGIDQSVWSKWLNGKVVPRIDALEGAAQALGIEENDFIAVFRKRRDMTMKQRQNQLDS